MRGDMRCVHIYVLTPLSLVQNVVRHWLKGGMPTIGGFMGVYYFRAACGLLWALTLVKHPQRSTVCGQYARM